MDPVMLPAILNVIAPVLALVATAAGTGGIIWLFKNHQYRMKELELESQRHTSPSSQQLAAIEARLAAIEAALSAPRHPLQDRAALLEGPATSGAETADPARLRSR